MTLLEHTIEKLTKNMPILKPIVVEIIPAKQMYKEYGGKCWGDCQDVGEHYKIRIAKGTTKEMTLIFIHEIAHSCCITEDPHGDEFGSMYSKAWKLFAGEV